MIFKTPGSIGKEDIFGVLGTPTLGRGDGVPTGRREDERMGAFRSNCRCGCGHCAYPAAAAPAGPVP